MHAQIAEAQKVAAGSGSEQDIAEAKVELKVRSGAEASMGLHLMGYMLSSFRRFWSAYKVRSSKPSACRTRSPGLLLHMTYRAVIIFLFLRKRFAGCW